MSAPVGYGIDFGTSNSAIAIAYPDRVEVALVDDGAIRENLRSLVYLHRGGNRATGEEAVRLFLNLGAAKHQCGRCPLVTRVDGQFFSKCVQVRQRGGCQDARIIGSVKSHLAQEITASTSSWGEKYLLEDLVAVILTRLKRVADERSGLSIGRAVLGYPVAFVGAAGVDGPSRQRIAEKRLEGAARIAGFSEVELFPEPAAAAITASLDDGIALALDFGGGTFDAAVIRFEDRQGDVRSLCGAPIGGQLFSDLLFSAKVAPALGLRDQFRKNGRSSPLPAQFVREMSSLDGVMRRLADPALPADLADYYGWESSGRIRQLDAVLFGGQAYTLFEAVERAKIELSDAQQAQIRVRREGLAVDEWVTRAEFEGLIRRDLRSVSGVIIEAMEMAEIMPHEIDVVLPTGGSSRLPAFRAVIEGMFEPSKIADVSAFSTVAEGLGRFAQTAWA